MKALSCPVDGCDVEKESVERLRAHANASLTHDWEEIKDSLEEQEGVVIEGNEVVEESLEEPDDQDDQPTEQPADEQEMTDDGEQWPENEGTDEQPTEQPESKQEGTEKGPKGSPLRDSPGDSEGVGIPIPVDTTTLVMIVGLVAMAVLLYQFATVEGTHEGTDSTGGSDSEESLPIDIEDVDDVDELPDDAGGLIDE